MHNNKEVRTNYEKDTKQLEKHVFLVAEIVAGGGTLIHTLTNVITVITNK